MHNCEKINDLLGPYIYGDLSDDERAMVERHVESCRDCSDELRSLRETAAKLSTGLAAPDARWDEFARRLDKRLAAGETAPHKAQAFERRLQWAAVAAVLVAALGVLFYFTRLELGEPPLPPGTETLCDTGNGGDLETGAVSFVESIILDVEAPGEPHENGGLRIIHPIYTQVCEDFGFHRATLESILKAIEGEK